MAKHKVHVEGMIYVFNVDMSTRKFITTTLKPEVSGIADDNSILYITTIADDEAYGYIAGETYIWEQGTLMKCNNVFSPQTAGSEETTLAVGGVPAGLKVSFLKGKSYDELFEMLLFPKYIAKLTEATASIQLYKNNGDTENNKQPHGMCVLPFTYQPYYKLSYTLRKATAGSYVAIGKFTSQSINSDADGLVIGSSDARSLFIKDGKAVIGTHKYANTAIFEVNKESFVKNTRGEDSPYVTANGKDIFETTAEASPSTYNTYTMTDDNAHYYLKAPSNKTAECYLYTELPIFASICKNALAPTEAEYTPTQLSLTTNTSWEVTLVGKDSGDSADLHTWTVEIPQEWTLLGIYQEDPLNPGSFPESNKQESILEGETTHDFIGDDNKTYTVTYKTFKHNGDDKGGAKYQVKIVKNASVSYTVK